MITFGEAKTSRVLRIASVCPNSPDFAQLLNDGIRLLMKRGNWTATVQFLTTCIWNNTATWPRNVGTVLGLDVGFQATIPVNYWHDWTWPGDVEARRRWNHWCRYGDVHMVAIGNSPVFNNIRLSSPSRITVFPTTPNDLGKSITFFGVDQFNRAVLTKRTDGTIQSGELVTLALPSVSTNTVFGPVSRVIKDQTQGRLNCFFFDTTQNVTVPMAVYEPGETAPMYTQSQVPPMRCRCPGFPQTISAMVKTEFVPVVVDDDLVQIDNLDALAIAMQSVKHSDAYDHAGAEAAMMRAVRDLNYQLRDKYPLEQTTVSFRPFGTATLQRLYLGMR